MIFLDLLRALGQAGDPRFRGVLFKGIGLSLLLLAGLYALVAIAIQAFGPEALTLPWIGEIGGIDALLSWASLFLMIGLSVFLMAPVAMAFAGLFLDDVAEAVEARHYPGLPSANKVSFLQELLNAFNSAGLLIAANIAGLAVWIFAPFVAPFVFWAMNGYLIGREYFLLAAGRRLNRQAAKRLRAANSLPTLGAGMLIALPLAIPIVNLLVPVFGVAAFTHLVHRKLARAEAAPSSRNPSPR